MKFGEIAWIIGEIFKMKGATMKILQLMQIIPGVNSYGGITIPKENLYGEIEFKNVSFEYPTKKDVKVSNKISLHIKNH
jgi:ABC-type multidrug transport system fused ATPase/permease subunit